MKRCLKIIIFGVCLGLVLIVIKKSLQISDDAFRRYYWIIAVGIVITAVLVNIIYNLSYQKKIGKAVMLLTSGKTQEYIAEIEKLLKTAKGRNLRNVLKLNLAAGHIDAKQFNAAIEILEGISYEQLQGNAVKMVYSLNLCISYFYARQTDKAMELYHASQTQFEPFRQNKTYGGSIAEADILAAMGGKQYDKAEELLATAQKSWSDPRLQEAFQEIGKRLAEIKSEVAGV